MLDVVAGGLIQGGGEHRLRRQQTHGEGRADHDAAGDLHTEGTFLQRKWRKSVHGVRNEPSLVAAMTPFGPAPAGTLQRPYHFVDKRRWTALFDLIARFLERERSPLLLVACAVAIAVAYVFVTFDMRFILGTGPFWANPRGPWLMDPNDTIDSVDVLTTRMAYIAFLHAPWNLPLFFVPDLGAPTGSSVILVDAVPVVALLGKLLAWATGVTINPYGLWVAACFILAALFAVLLLMELGQRSLLAAIAASLLAISMPALLYRFGHLSLQGQFVVIGALWLYARDAHTGRVWRRLAWWAGWLCLAALLHGYLFVMVAAIYAATVLRRVDTERPSVSGALREPALVACCVAALIAVAGHFGKGTGTSASGDGYGYFSMNLLSPLWPQRSGLFPGFYGLLTGPDGQYEGFNYLGAGVLLLVAVAVTASWRVIPQMIRRHLVLIVTLVYLAIFAISNVVFIGSHGVLYVPLPQALQFVAGIFRSSGRMFWPCAYALALFGLVLALRHLKPGWKTVAVLGCCVLQLIDTNPLRARMTTLTQREVPTLLDLPEWEARMLKAERVHVVPSFVCGGYALDVVQLEMQTAAMTARRPINAVYNPRLQDDCAASVQSAMRGPWDDHTLYVFFQAEGVDSVPAGWRPPGLACEPFDRGVWCLGDAGGAR
jgi:hypothetical protein